MEDTLIILLMYGFPAAVVVACLIHILFDDGTPKPGQDPQLAEDARRATLLMAILELMSDNVNGFDD